MIKKNKEIDDYLIEYLKKDLNEINELNQSILKKSNGYSKQEIILLREKLDHIHQALTVIKKQQLKTITPNLLSLIIIICVFIAIINISLL